MRRILLSVGGVSALLIAVPVSIANAADMPLKEAPLPPAAVLSWTGFYAGLNAGGTWGSNNSVNTVSSLLADLAPGPSSYGASSALGATGSVPVGGNAGFIGGGQIGFNWQFDPRWVAGFEADIQGVANHNSNGGLATAVGPISLFGNPDTVRTQINSRGRLDYLGTVRGRLGVLVTPTLLAYGTGGLAYGGVKASTSISQSNNDCTFTPGACIQGAAATAGAVSSTLAGWTAGGGLESMFGQHWSAKVEYMYYDLGSVTFGDGALVTSNGTFPPAGGPAVVTSQSTTHFKGNIVRVGANYHF
jgi:outer membrane immunogenic protein